MFQGWVVVTITSLLTDFFGEPPKGSSQLVLEVLMNGGYFQAVAEVPLQQGHVQQAFFRAHDAQKLSSSQNRLSPSYFLVLFHVPGDCFFRNRIHNEEGAEFIETFFQVINNMNVDL